MSKNEGNITFTVKVDTILLDGTPVPSEQLLRSDGRLVILHEGREYKLFRTKKGGLQLALR